MKRDLIEADRKIATGIDYYAEQVDLYLAKRRYVTAANKSHLVLRNAFTVSQDGQRKYTPQVGVKLHIPNLQEKLQLNFTSYDEDKTDRGINRNRVIEPDSNPEYGTSLALFQELGKVRTEFRPRLDFHGSTPQTSYLFRFWSGAEEGAVAFEPEMQLFARSDTGTGEYLALDARVKLGADDEVQIVNEEQYTDSDNTLSTNHGPRWTHRYDKVRSQETAFIIESTNRSAYHLDQYVLSSSFSHQFWPNVLHYAVMPYWTFRKDAHFHPVTAVEGRVEVIF